VGADIREGVLAIVGWMKGKVNELPEWAGEPAIG